LFFLAMSCDYEPIQQRTKHNRPSTITANSSEVSRLRIATESSSSVMSTSDGGAQAVSPSFCWSLEFLQARIEERDHLQDLRQVVTQIRRLKYHQKSTPDTSKGSGAACLHQCRSASNAGY
jgi:hypothetical protein